MTKSRDLANAATALTAVSATELAFVDGVTSAIQTQIDTKLATATAATTYVANSLADAKGDLFVATADNTVTRLPVGNSGEQIVADSSTSTGLRYTAGNPIANPVLNSTMQVAQRGTSFTVTAGLYTLDRWQGYRGVAGSTITRQNTSDTTNLPNIQYCARVARNSGNTATNAIIFTQDFETVNSIPYAGKTVTLSFYARAGANYSATSNVLYGGIITGTGTDQNNTTGSYTGAAASLSTNFTLTTTWQRFTSTGSIPSTTTEMEVKFVMDPTGTAGANDYFEVTGVQIDIGSVALPFRTYAATIQGELAACQRYYQRITTTTTYGRLGFGMATGTTNCQVIFPLKTTMRTSVSAIDFSGNTHFVMNDGVSNTATSAAPTLDSMQNPDNCLIIFTAASGLTQFRPYNIAGNNNATAYIGFSAEL